LVADEVGLGKTVVAQHVIRAMMRRSDGPLVVFYMCSNLAIARQNRRKLLEVLPKDERKEADCSIDRLSLMLAYDRPTHRRLNLYSLTPDTSIPIRKGHRRDGRKEERALVHALVEHVWPHVLEERGSNLFQGNATTHWRESVKYQDARAAKTALREAFKRSVRKEFGLESGPINGRGGRVGVVDYGGSPDRFRTMICGSCQPSAESLQSPGGMLDLTRGFASRRRS
jgi:hypothetical protein